MHCIFADEMKSAIIFYTRVLAVFLLLLTVSLPVLSQVHGVVTDSLTREPVSFVQVYYEGTSVGTQTDEGGRYTLPVLSGSGKVNLVFSSIEYVKKVIPFSRGVGGRVNVLLQENAHLLGEVTVKPHRGRYRRKNNPAVELMRRVIANKWRSDPKRSPWYSYYGYQKMTTALDELTPEKMKGGIFKQMPFLVDQVEVDPVTHRLILPLVMEETVTRHLWRQQPSEEQKTLVMGHRSSGINDLLSVGEGLGAIMQSFFGAVNIHDEDINLLEKRFISPIASRGAISFYQYYIMDTLQVEGDSCIHLTFVPQNSQDFGFSGHLYVVKDSTWQVKRCRMTLPQKTGVNFVEGIDILQDFQRQSDGRWALVTDDFRVNLSLVDMLQSVQVQRITRYSDHSTRPLEASLFEVRQSADPLDAPVQDADFWNHHRPLPLTDKEKGMDSFVDNVKQMPGFRYIIFAVRALVENFIETGSEDRPSKFDIGPVNTFVSTNYIDGLRLRLSGKTTAAFNPHLFFKGYVAYGFKDARPKYKAEVEYSFAKKKRLPFEFPRRSIAFSHQYDVMAPADKYLVTDKDNMFLSLKANTVDQMSFIRRNALTFVYEADNTFSTTLELRHTDDKPVGRLSYIRQGGLGESVHRLTTAEASLTLRYAPGEKFVNSKQGRLPVNRNASVFCLSHTVGLDGVLGSSYHYHITEASVYKRFWLSSWGRVNAMLKGGMVWNLVPFPLLLSPAANQSFIIQNNHFHMMNNMEFLNDRYASLDLTVELNGVLLNRIPLLKHLKWREVFGVNVLYGGLSDKNNPYLHPTDDRLFLFPQRDGQTTSFIMDADTPYVEYHVGLHNVFKILRIEYWRRLTYLHLPDASKHGVRMALQFKF